MKPSSARVLLADDDESLRRVQEYQLTKAGFAVTTTVPSVLVPS